MFSIVIPVFNKEKYVGRAISSVLNQTFSEFELIIIDDGSTDNSMCIIEQFKDSRIKIISKENEGVSTARNVGIKNAKYEYIAFLDADDVWNPNFLKIVYKLIQDFPEAGAYYTNYKIVKKEKKQNDQFKINKDYKCILINDYFLFAIKDKPMWTSCVVVKKHVLNDIGGFPQNITRGEDIYLWTKIALKYKIAYTNYIGAYYYKNVPNSLTKKKFSLEKNFTNYAEDFYHKNKNLAVDPTTFKEYMIRIIVNKAKYYIEMSKKREARVLLSKYFKTRYFKKKVYILYILSALPDFMVVPIINKIL